MSSESLDPKRHRPDDIASRPLHLLPRFVERIWGSHSLAPYFPPSDKTVGEVWLTAENCQIEGSALTLGQLTAQAPHALGSIGAVDFPLLVKLLFPREQLSVQVHPDDAYAQAKLGQPNGKTECWYVLSAEPGAQVAIGFREPMSEAAIRRSIQEGSIESHLRMLTVQAGDMLFIEAGTVHAIGGGVILLETQQYSDVTYRLWDYGRPRELHVQEGLAVMRAETGSGLVQPKKMEHFDRLVSCPYFTVDRFHLDRSRTEELSERKQLQIVIALTPGALLRDAAGNVTPLPQAHAVLLTTDAPAQVLLAEADAQVIRIMPASSQR